MKKTILSLAVVLSCGLLTSCGTMGTMGGGNNTGAGIGQSVLGGASATDLIGNLISTFASGIMTNQSSIVGTWTYSAPCVQFESQNLLTQAGGTVAATNMEKKLESIYSMVGIKPGVTRFVFNQNGTMQYTIGSSTMQGKYTFNAKNKTVTITTQSGMTITAYVSVSIGQMALTFDTSKLLQLVSGGSAISSSLGTISSLASSFNGMKMGFKFTK